MPPEVPATASGRPSALKSPAATDMALAGVSYPVSATATGADGSRGGSGGGGGSGTLTVSASTAVSPPPSVTTSVTVAVPYCPAAGVTVTVRLPADPPRTIAPAGTSAGFDDDAATVSAAAGVSAS